MSPAAVPVPEQLLKKQSSMLNSVRRSENRSRKLQKYAISTQHLRTPNSSARENLLQRPGSERQSLCAIPSVSFSPALRKLQRTSFAGPSLQRARVPAAYSERRNAQARVTRLLRTASPLTRTTMTTCVSSRWRIRAARLFLRSLLRAN